MVAPATSERKEYQILRKLAVGGMAEIYLARTLGLGGFEKYVVLKRILPTFANDAQFIEMFLDEARLAALLHHQNIAQVHDIGQANGSYFFTMEYLHGVDIRQLWSDLYTRNAALPMSHALTIVAGACSGLHYAHDKLGPDGQPLRIVHRDVSLSNIVVTYDGGVKLVDFGVARAAARDSKTRTGSLKGKVGYMSPEQCRGKPLDRRSDIFSLGVVLFELTTGDRPFGDADGVNDYSTMFQIVESEPTRPKAIDPDYPADLEHIVLRALAKDPDDRYPTARALLADIEAFAANHRLPLSASALAGFMEEIYGHPPEPWHQLEEEVKAPQSPVRRTITFAEPDASTSSPAAATIFASETDPSAFGAPPADPASHSRPYLPLGHDPHMAPPASGNLGSPLSPSTSQPGRALSAHQGPHRKRVGRSVLAVVMVVAGIAAGLAIAWQLSQSSREQAPAQPAAIDEIQADEDVPPENQQAADSTRPDDEPAGTEPVEADPTATAAAADADDADIADGDPIDVAAVTDSADEPAPKPDGTSNQAPATKPATPTKTDDKAVRTPRRAKDDRAKSSDRGGRNRRDRDDKATKEKDLAEQARKNADLEW